jgi:DNA-directed RNA polymerase specialized sigma24 family protein
VTQHQQPTRRKNTDNRALSRRRRRDVVENDEYAAFARRILAAYGRRVAAGDVEALAALVQLGAQVEEATRTAVIGLREHGYSWTEIGDRLGVSRQAARQRWNEGPQ